MKQDNNIKDLRIKKGMSVAELASKAGISERYMYFIEAGDKRPSLDKAQKISKALETQVEKIF